MFLLILVIIFSFSQFSPPSFEVGIPKGGEWLGIFLGSFLAFYAFIGFEDMVNLAEEVKKPQKTLPRAIFLALGVATILYVLVALAAVSALPTEELAKSDAPFALLFEKRGFSPVLISLISLIAIINSALVQIIMASRVLYGIAKQKAAPQFFAEVNPFTKTPIYATALMGLCVVALALFFPIITLVQLTSFIILIIFAVVNLSLIILKRRKKKVPRTIYFPMIIPIIGFLFCIVLLVGRIVFR